MSPVGQHDDAVGDAELGDEPLGVREQALVLVPRVLGPREDELLDLVELVDAEHPARVLARRAGLRAKARREADVAERQGVRIEDLVAVEAADRDLRRSREIEILALELVEFGSADGSQPVP